MGADPYKYFRVEARELLEQLERGALDLEKGVPSADALARLLRLAHTLKGAARVVKQPRIAEQAHQLEDVFTSLRDALTPPDPAQIDGVLKLLDRIGAGLAALSPAAGKEPAVAPAATEPPVHAFRPEAAELQALVDGIDEARIQVTALKHAGDEATRVRHLIDLVDDQVRGRAREWGTARDGAINDKLPSLLHELRRRMTGLERGLLQGVDRVERGLHEAGETAARLRLVSAGRMFHFLERAARDTAEAVGKHVTFEGRGGDVRVDSEILSVAQGALLQLVRNAVAHGIEVSATGRKAAGKPADGRVTVTVARRGAGVSFICADDGAGIDFNAVRRAAERARQTTGAEQPLDQDALMRLLLKGGISTSERLTDVAGRGIGLDVVREAAERLGGDVRMRSEPGRGTSIELVLPSTISSFQALVVEAASVCAAVPIDAVRGTLRVSPSDVMESPRGDSISYGRQHLSLTALRRLVGRAETETRRTAPFSAFVVEADEGGAAFAVDRIVGTATVVMRPVPELAPVASWVAGVAIDGGGRAQLVADPAGLLREARRTLPTRAASAVRRPSILVIDDSLTTRMLERSILETAGYDVSVASSGEEALEKARATSHALFLVDVEMPGMDGFTFIEQARADPALRHIPSILVTSRASAEDRQRGRDVGAQAYIDKSDFDQAALLERIGTLVR